MLENLLQAIKDKLRVYSNYLAIGIIILLIISLARNISKIMQVQDKIQKKEEEIQKLAERNKELQKQLEEINSEEFTERQLREKLGLAKEGEVVVVLPEQDVLKELAPEPRKEEERLPDPNWKKWLDLFL